MTRTLKGFNFILELILNKIFLDCGANVGTSIDMFRNKFPLSNDYKIYSFEPNPSMAKKLKNKDVTYFNKAVWINNGHVNFYLGASKFSHSSSLIKNKTTGNLSKTPTKVSCIDISNWILSKFNNDDYIVLKLDIEGAEYDVLDKMITDGSIKYINEIYIDWHYKKVNVSQARHDSLVQRLVDLNLTPLSWSTESNSFGKINLR